MIIEITNHYHKTVKEVKANSLREAEQNHIGGLEVTAHNLAEQEIEEDWEIIIIVMNKLLMQPMMVFWNN